MSIRNLDMKTGRITNNWYM